VFDARKDIILYSRANTLLLVIIIKLAVFVRSKGRSWTNTQSMFIISIISWNQNAAIYAIHCLFWI